MSLWRALLVAAAIVGPGATVASTFIPVADRVDHLFDAVTQILYISTTSGRIERYDMRSRRLMRPFNVGGDLRGMDITPDAASIYVGEAFWGPVEGILRKVNVETGAVTNLIYDRYFDEAGSWDVSIGGYGPGLLTTDYYGSGDAPARTLDLAEDSLTERYDIGIGLGVSTT